MIQRIAWLAAVGLFFVCAAGIASMGSVWNRKMRAPIQPVAFSHVRHALENELACTHCHQYADRSRHATVPAMSICAECHGQMETQNAEVKKLQKFLARRQAGGVDQGPQSPVACLFYPQTAH